MKGTGNRTVLTLLGALLLAGVVLWLLAALNVVALKDPGELYAEAGDGYASSPAVWNTVTVVILVILIALSLLWLLSQLRAPERDRSIGTITVDRRATGSTTFDVNSLCRAAASDLESLPGVTRARVRVTEGGRRPVVRAGVTTDQRVDLDAIRREFDGIMERMRQVLDADDIRLDVTYRPRIPTSQRVV